MLQNSQAFSSFSVNDLAKAKQFYSEILEQKVTEVGTMGLNLELATGANVFMFPIPDHVPATFTVLNFPVDDIITAVDELISRGITFVQYTGELQTDEKGIHWSDSKEHGPHNAWFKDPSGNFIAIVQEVTS